MRVCYTETQLRPISHDKYKRLKRRFREIIEQNEVLANDLSQAKKRLRRLAKERDILLDRICKYDQYNIAFENPTELRKPTSPGPQIQKEQIASSTNIAVTPTVTTLPTISNLMVTNDDESPPSDGVIERAPSPPLPAQLPHTPYPWQQQQPYPSTTTIAKVAPPSSKSSPPHNQFQHLSHHQPSAFSPNPSPHRYIHLASSSDLTYANVNISSSGGPKVEIMQQDGRMVPSSRPKRMRRGPVESRMRRVQPLEKDPDSGEYVLPARVGILTVHSLGRVVPLPTYHNDRYIWPPGFKVSRTYLSMVNPDANTVYTCSVEENGEQGPRFRVVAEDYPDQPIIANSATGVWTAIVKRANEIRNREHSNSASGPDYYGFTHATIAKMIQDLPGAENCINYVWQKFGEMHQRTAAGVAAAAQKKLTNLEIMGSANKRPPPSLTTGSNAKKEATQRDVRLPPLPPPSYRSIQPQLVSTELATMTPAESLTEEQDVHHFRAQCQYENNTPEPDVLKAEEIG